MKSITVKVIEQSDIARFDRALRRSSIIPIHMAQSRKSKLLEATLPDSADMDRLRACLDAVAVEVVEPEPEPFNAMAAYANSLLGSMGRGAG
jgi:hypothetical protein